MQIGYSSKLPYDSCAYPDKMYISTGTLGYQLDVNKIKNCKECLSVFGPRSSHNGFGVATALRDISQYPAPAQQLVDVESILHNYNIPTSKCKNNMLNPVGIKKVPSYKYEQCNSYLDPNYSHLTNPPLFYRELAMNRFFDPYNNPQLPIFYDFSVNTRLQLKDSYVPVIPNVSKYQVQSNPKYEPTSGIIVDVNRCIGNKCKK